MILKVLPSPTQPVNSEVQGIYAMIAATIPAENPSQPWTKVRYRYRKNGKTKPLTSSKVEQRGLEIFFPRKNGGQLESVADLMIVLNQALQKGEVESNVQFSRIRYAPSGFI